jgi:ACR3 family arsenite efflux pump ArsB
MFCEAWFIVMSVFVWLMVPLPAGTLPPVGRVSARVEDVIVKSIKEKIPADMGFTKAFLIERKQ